jgi:hypothetical protein
MFSPSSGAPASTSSAKSSRPRYSSPLVSSSASLNPGSTPLDVAPPAFPPAFLAATGFPFAAGQSRSAAIGESSATPHSLPKQAKKSGIGKKSGRPIGGDAGRTVKRQWEQEAASMPQPLTLKSKTILCQRYIAAYDAIGVKRSLVHARKAVFNLGPEKRQKSIVSVQAPRTRLLQLYTICR